jgi:ribokinase
MTRFCCAGPVTWDVTLRVERLPDPDGEGRITGQQQASGGSAANAAAVLAGLDREATLVGGVGVDEHGHLLRRELDALGVETALIEVPDAATTVSYLVVDEEGEVMLLGNEGAADRLDAEAIEAAALAGGTVEAADHLHLTGLPPEAAVELATTADAAGLSVSFDPGDRIADRAYDPVLELADTVFLDEAAADLLAGEDPFDDDQTVVTTRGRDGATVRRGDEAVSHGGFLVEPVDTTGASDAFAAGFLAAREERSLEGALAVGNACGALAARSPGSRAYLSWSDVEAMLAVED